MDEQELGGKASPGADGVQETSTLEPLRIVPPLPIPGGAHGLLLSREDGSGALSSGSTLAGRYTVLHQLGQGGMGVVLAAYDARLGRRVALKLLRSERGSQGGGISEQNARQVREAMAMARLSHPNVVAVYDAGPLEDGSIFIAMEYVQGQTLRQWCAQRARSWRESLDAYLAAGRGLAAAHAAGLVHRDFKPDNVLVDEAGRVRVTDFGLARRSEGLAGKSTGEHSPEAAEPARPTHPLELPLTREGAVLGTPAYMAPEQFRGIPVDARCDQFSFAVALWEALHGERPFEGDTFAARKANVLAMRIRPPPPHSKVPPWISHALQRALVPEPGARYPSLDALLATLERDPARVRRQWLSAVALFLLVTGSCLLAYGLWHQRHAQLCTGGPEKLVGIWDAPRKVAIEKAFLATGRDYARDTWGRVRETLDAHTAAWLKMHQDTCEATRLRGEQSEAVMSLRMACLEGRRQELAALSEVFTGADETVVEKALSATSSLRRLRGCADVEALLSEVKPPEEATTREAVQNARAQLARVKAFTEAGKFKEAMAQATEVARKTSKLGYPPVHAEALFTQAWVQIIAGENKGVPPQLTEALWLAHDSRHDTIVAAASTRLMGYYCQRGPQEELDRWERFARSWLDRLGEDGELRAIYHNNRGLALYQRGQFAEAHAAFDKASVLAAQALGPAHATTLRYASNSQAALGNLDRMDESLRALEELISTGERNLGPVHPFLVQPMLNLSGLYVAQARFSDARRTLDRIREIVEQASLPGSEEWAYYHLSAGELDSEQGRDAESLEHYEEAVRMWQELTGPESTDALQSLLRMAESQQALGRLPQAQQTFQRVFELTKKGPRQQEFLHALALRGLADLHAIRGQHDKALRLHQQGLELRERLLGAEHFNTALSRMDIANSYLKLGQPARALALLERVQALFEKTAALDSITGTMLVASKGEALLKLGMPSEAIPLLERALRSVAAHRGRPEYLATVQSVLARALLRTGQQPERALQLAQLAHATYAQAPIRFTSELAELEALLKQQASHLATMPSSK
ncbi:tetratricopeptide repeat protein [Archangium violaceum]|uniref:tetratricopeptide repeat protein n=1 Tax=Archangium violaceum TaxID=83451 RepID=UPI0036D984C9